MFSATPCVRPTIVKSQRYAFRTLCLVWLPTVVAFFLSRIVFKFKDPLKLCSSSSLIAYCLICSDSLTFGTAMCYNEILPFCLFFPVISRRWWTQYEAGYAIKLTHNCLRISSKPKNQLIWFSWSVCTTNENVVLKVGQTKTRPHLSESPQDFLKARSGAAGRL